jgi:hypothetical protein
LKPTKSESNKFEAFKILIEIMRDDPVINEKVLAMLKMNSYRRRSVLNNWLEQLRLRKASGNLLNALSCLFDDEIAEQVLAFINDPKI